MRRFDLPKFVFYTVGILGVLIVVFTLGTHAGSKETLSYRLIRGAYDNVKLVKNSLKTLFGIEPSGYSPDSAISVRSRREAVLLSACPNMLHG